MASLRFFRANSTLFPWLAIPSSEQFATYQFPSLVTTDENSRDRFTIQHRPRVYSSDNELPSLIPFPNRSKRLAISYLRYYTPDRWYNASITIAAGWIRSGGKVEYYVNVQPPDDVRLQLNRLGLNAELLEKEDKLRIWDSYTVALGQKSREKYSYDSLKVADLSIQYARDFMRLESTPEVLVVSDNFSVLDRFNDEKVWVEYALSRAIPGRKLTMRTAVRGIMKGVHSDWVYKQLEGAVQGIIDFKVEDVGTGTKNLIRVRSMRNVGFDSEWQSLKVSENFEVTLEK